MKTILLLAICSCAALFLVSCTPNTTTLPKTEIDGEIEKIVTEWVEGFAPFPRVFTRTFDFTTNSIIDTRVTDYDDLTDEQLQLYNHPTVVAAFDDNSELRLISTINDLGFFKWNTRYVTDDIICDGGHEIVTVYYSSGTEKTTYIYFEYPPNYTQIQTAFEEILGENLYMEW